jgi:hypothetical protein
MKTILVVGAGLDMAEALVRLAHTHETTLIMVRGEVLQGTCTTEQPERGITLMPPPEKIKFEPTELKARDMFIPKEKRTYVKNQLSYKNRRKK